MAKKPLDLPWFLPSKKDDVTPVANDKEDMLSSSELKMLYECEPMPQGPRPYRDLNEGDCQWPTATFNEQGVELYCGAPAVAGKPYCMEHGRIGVGRQTRTVPYKQRKPGKLAQGF